MSRPRKCSIHGCPTSPTTPLRAVDGVFWFCDAHAEKYEALGYLSVEAQTRLANA